MLRDKNIASISEYDMSIAQILNQTCDLYILTNFKIKLFQSSSNSNSVQRD